jgi:hypothetical protein
MSTWGQILRQGGAPGLLEGDQVVDLGGFERVAEGGHVIAAIQNPDDEIRLRQPLADPRQVRTAPAATTRGG